MIQKCLPPLRLVPANRHAVRLVPGTNHTYAKVFSIVTVLVAASRAPPWGVHIPHQRAADAIRFDRA